MIYHRTGIGLLLIFPILSGLPATGQDAPSFDFPRNPDYLLIDARESWTVKVKGEETLGLHTLRVFGDDLDMKQLILALCMLVAAPSTHSTSEPESSKRSRLLSFAAFNAP